MSALKFHPIAEIIADVAAGKLVIVADDPSRENEADLLGAASLCSKEMVNFMAVHGRGLICAPITLERAEELDLPQMTRRNLEGMKTAFTISVDAAKGITTGISAADRALTIRLLADADAGAEAFVKPGHIFPLQAMSGGVLRRAGHTEAAVDLVKLAGLPEVGVICEIMDEEGSMARVGDLGEYQEKHGLKACTIAQLIEYRRRSEKFVKHESTVLMPTDYGDFDCHLYTVSLDDSHHLAMTRGKINPDEPTLVRVHSECLTGDVFHSQRCDCGPQLDAAMKHISEDGGVLLYLRQEGRGIGLPAKIHAYKLQEPTRNSALPPTFAITVWVRRSSTIWVFAVSSSLQTTQKKSSASAATASKSSSSFPFRFHPTSTTKNISIRSGSVWATRFRP